jgi:hypothetical protein
MSDDQAPEYRKIGEQMKYTDRKKQSSTSIP